MPKVNKVLRRPMRNADVDIENSVKNRLKLSNDHNPSEFINAIPIEAMFG